MLKRLAPRILRAPNTGAFSTSFTRWNNVEMGPKDPILGVSEAFKADPSPKKLNLGVGAYRDDNGLPVILHSVNKASHHILHENMDHEYSPIEGLRGFIDNSLMLAFGENSIVLQEKNVAAIQSLSGTGALRLIGEFVDRFADGATPAVYLPNPTWGNHFNVFRDCRLEVKQYAYYDPSTKGLDLKGLLRDLEEAPDNQVVLLHASAHNPTGVDPKPEQWAAISNLCLKKGHFVIFDMAYQGFASGNAADDAASVQMFVNDGHDIALAQSFSKNFGLYGQRIGCASIMVKDKNEADRVQSQMKILARAMYSNPPLHGARIVNTVLSDPVLKNQWLEEVNDMAQRIIEMRHELRSKLEQIGSELCWKHITEQIGMFCYSGLSPEQVDRLTNEHHIYLTRNGRISMAGLGSHSVGYLAEAIHDVTKID